MNLIKYNTENEAIRNGLMQTSSIKTNTLNAIYDPTHGSIPDAFEASWNYLFGKTPLKSGNYYELNTYSQNLAQASKKLFIILLW